MEPTAIYIILGIAIVLLIIGFVLSKIAGCGFKILRILIILAVIAYALYYASTFFVK